MGKLSEFMFMKDFRFGKPENKIEIDGQEILNEINHRIDKLYLYLVISVILNLWQCI